MKRFVNFLVIFILAFIFIPSFCLADSEHIKDDEVKNKETMKLNIEHPNIKNTKYIKVRIQSPLKSNKSVKLSSESGFSITTIDQIFDEIEKIDSNEIKVVLDDENKDIIVIKDKLDNVLFSFKEKDNILISSQCENFDSIVKVENNNYRDFITFNRDGNSLIVINYVTLSHYLYGVVPREMPSSFPVQALKAQAVASRTFTLKNMNKHIKSGYNLCDTTHCQVYGGYDWEKENTNSAVDNTQNIIIKYNGELIDAVYHSNSGGYTEDSKYAWLHDVPYLKGVDDKFSIGSPNDKWKVLYKDKDIKNKFARNNINVGDIKNIKVEHYSPNGRIIELKIEGTNGSDLIKGNELRNILGYDNIKSNWFEISRKTVDKQEDEVYENKIHVIDGKSIKPTKINLKDIYTINNTQVKIFSDKKVQQIVTSKGVEVNKVLQNYDDDKENVFVIEGKGYGHGVGMSQWGSKKMAELGYDYDEILKHYYTNVQVVEEEY